jgi:protein SCO1/2
MSPWKWITLAAVAASATGALLLWHARPAPAGKLGAEYFPNVELTTQDGETVHFYEDLIKGKIVAINFIYSNCGFSCPLETARLAQVQEILGDRLGRDIFFYSISIDPGHDTPKVLKEYAEKFNAGPGWTFLTGKRSDIDRLAAKLGMTDDVSVTDAPGAELDGHEPHLLIGNEASGQWLRDSGTDNPRFLAHLIGNFVDGGAAVPHSGGSGLVGAPMNIASAGQYLFGKECAACHTIGHGDKIGPDLAEVTRTRDPDWLARYIAEPDKMLAAGDPIAASLQEKYRVTMPNLRVGDKDLAVLLDFLAAQASDRRAR